MSNQPTTRIIPIVQTSTPSSNRDSPVTFARQDASNIEVVPNAPTSSLNPSNYQSAQVPSSYNHIRDVSPANRPSTEATSPNRPMQRKTSIEDVGDKVFHSFQLYYYIYYIVGNRNVRRNRAPR